MSQLLVNHEGYLLRPGDIELGSTAGSPPSRTRLHLRQVMAEAWKVELDSARLRRGAERGCTASSQT